MNPSFFLPFFIFFDTIRALTAFGVMRAGIPLPAAAVSLWSELFKLTCALIFHRRWLRRTQAQEGFFESLFPRRSSSQLSSSTWSWLAAYDIRLVLHTAIPAALYLTNNLLYLIALRFTSPALLNIAVLAKLPFTAVLHFLILGRARSAKAWISLAVLCMGLLSLNLPWSKFLSFFYDTNSTDVGAVVGEAEVVSTLAMFGPLIGFLIAGISAFTSIVTEAIMKQKVPFWTVQIWLYLYGAIFAGILVQLGVDQAAATSLEAIVNGVTTDQTRRMAACGAVAVVTGVTGIVVANILRKADNLVKLIGGSGSVVATLVLQPFLFPELWQQSFNSVTILAVGVITISTWTYNYYKDEPAKQAIRLPATPVPEKSDVLDGPDLEMADKDAVPLLGVPSLAESEPAPSAVKQDCLTPTLPKIAGMFAFFSGLAFLASLQTSGGLSQ